MSPNEQKITSGVQGEVHGLVDQLDRRDADGAAWSMYEGDRRRQQGVDAEAARSHVFARRRPP